MKDYVIINGVSSKTKTGLAINILPPITKPKMRTLTEEIDGRDGDIITKLGYSAYDKTIEIGLFGNGYDVDDIIAFFNKEGTITFSNEPTKYYNFTLVDSFDIERLLQFKTATITFHCQPFKYEVGETPAEIEYQYVTDEGTELTLNNTANTKMQLELNPSELTQETTTGANKFSSEIAQGTINSGTGQPSYATNRVRTNYYICTDSSTQYTVSLKNSTLYDVILFQYDVNNGFISATSNWVSVPYTFTTSSTTKNIKFVFRLKTDVDLTPSDVSELILKAGSTAEPYEEYTGGIHQPNPDYPSEVQVIKGNNSIKIENKNLLNPNNLVIASPFVSMSSENILTIEVNSTGYFKTAFDDLKLPSGTYTFYCEILSGNYTGGNLCFFDLNNTQVSGEFNFKLTTTYPNHTYTKTFDNGLNQLKFYKPYCTSETKIKIWIAKGTYEIMPEFVKHQEQVLSLNLPNGIEYCKIGTYEDEFEHDGDKWYLNKYIGKTLLNGTETWNLQIVAGGNNYYTRINEAFGSEQKVIYSNLFVYRYFNSLESNVPQNVGFISTGKNLNFLASQFNDVSALKTFLTTTNMIVYYQLATPTHTEITDSTLISQLNAIEQAVSYDEQTNISQTNAELPFRIKATAMINGSESVEIINNGNIYAKPILDIKGTGTINIYLNGTQMLSVDITDEIVIDVPNLEAYNPNTTALMNRNVTGDISKFILPVGTNTISVDGDVELVTITLYRRWL